MDSGSSPGRGERFRILEGIEIPENVNGHKGVRVVSQIFASWNQLHGWLRQVDGLQLIA